MAILKSYSLANIYIPIDFDQLSTEVSTSGSVTGFTSITVEDGALVINGATLVDEPLLDTTIANHSAESLVDYKAMKIKAIDERTGELISQGYTYDSKVFSLSSNGQINLLALYTTRLSLNLTFPIEYSTIDDLDTYIIADETVVEAMYFIALDTKRIYLDSGTILKKQVNASTDKAGVDAVIDNR